MSRQMWLAMDTQPGPDHVPGGGKAICRARFASLRGELHIMYYDAMQPGEIGQGLAMKSDLCCK